MQEDIRTGAKDFSQSAKKEMNTQKDNLKDFGSMASAKASEFSRDLADKSGEYYGVGKTFIEKNPILSVSVAAGLGVLVGSVIAGVIANRD